MSFDLGFDFRSLVVFEAGVPDRLDDWAIRNTEAFLEAHTVAHESAERQGRSFSADVVLVDHAVADGVQQEGPFTVGEHHELITDPAKRVRLLEVLRPVLTRLVDHPRVTINLMNEPEFVSMSALQALPMYGTGSVDVIVEASPGALRKDVTAQAAVAEFLTRADQNIQVSFLHGRPLLKATQVSSSDVQWFLVDLLGAVLDAASVKGDLNGDGLVGFEGFLSFASCFGSSTGSDAFLQTCDLTNDGIVDFSDFLLLANDFGRRPRLPPITVGWADDVSALTNTRELERLAGRTVTDVISFHVYDVSENRFHPLTTVRDDFVRAGYGERSIRITEWGLGRVGASQVGPAVSAVFDQVSQSGFDGVMFWWDATHTFTHAG